MNIIEMSGNKNTLTKHIKYLPVLALMVVACTLYMNWQGIINHVIEWQKVFHELLAGHVRKISQDPINHGLALVGLSFAYGVFHAIGPGHGKAVIITYLGSHKETLKRGATISLLAALFQALVAITLIVVLTKVLSIRFSDVNNYAENVTTASYVMVMILGIFLFASASIRQLKLMRTNKQTSERQHDESHAHDHSHEHDHGHEHSHDHACCGGHHVHQSTPNESWTSSIGVIFSMGIRPCSGAIVVLIYAQLVGAFSYGVIAALMMGFGTGLSIACIALGTQLARHWFEQFADAESSHSTVNIGLWLRMAGGVLIFLLGLSLYQAATQVVQGHPLM